VSETAAERLARIGACARLDGDDLEFLFACLGADRKAVQRPAAEMLAAIAAGDAAVRGRLGDALDAPEPLLRWGAVYALSRTGAPLPARALGVLLDVFGLGDGDMRWAAAAIVVGLGGEGAPPALVALAAEGNAAQRKMALYCLRDLVVRTPAALARVRERLEDGDVGVRLAAMAALARLAAPAAAAAALVARLVDDDAGVRRTAAATLGRLGVGGEAVVAGLRAAAAADDPVLARAARRALDLVG